MNSIYNYPLEKLETLFLLAISFSGPFSISSKIIEGLVSLDICLW